jgi:hypothetical protein
MVGWAHSHQFAYIIQADSNSSTVLRGELCMLPVPAGWLACADDVWGLLDIQASSAADQLQLQQSQQEATGYLRHLIAAAAGRDKRVLSDAAQAFLGKDRCCRSEHVSFSLAHLAPAAQIKV